MVIRCDCMRTQITNVSIFQNAKLLSILVAPFGLIYSLIGIFLLTIEGMRSVAILFILAPIWFSLLYFVIVAVFATIYNFVSSKIGGIEFELTEIED